MKMKKWIAGIALGSMMLLAGCGGGNSSSSAGDSSATAEADADALQIGIIQTTAHTALDRARDGFEDGLEEAGYTIGKDVVIDYQNAQGDQSNLNTITSQFASDKKDLVCAIATQAAVQMKSASSDIPIVGTAITDYESVGLVDSNDAPGGNVTGTSDMNPIEDQVALMQKMMPDLKTVGVMYCSAEENSRIQVELFKEQCEAVGISVTEMTVSNVNEIQQAATSLIGEDIQAIYVPTDNTLASAMPTLTGVTNDAKIPVFTGEVGMLSGGGLATVSVDYYELGKQTGLMAAKILKGEAQPADMPIEMAETTTTEINQEEVDLLGITVPDDLTEYVGEYAAEE
ncbi:MAG: ABC transporter substrate-binding protein [Peptococcaceae bacterium]|nr:ABC transporter substrate-binding protein [Peptococcaceae bacterium]